jgi:glycerol uptake facilitator-like aquaporin
VTSFEIITDWIIAAGSAVLVGVVIASWLASYRAPKAASSGSSKWFALPAWAQIGGGLIAVALFVLLGYAL